MNGKLWIAKELAKSATVLAVVVGSAVGATMAACDDVSDRHAKRNAREQAGIATVVVKDCGATDLNPCYSFDNVDHLLILDYDAPYQAVKLDPCNGTRSNVTTTQGCFTRNATPVGYRFLVTIDATAVNLRRP